MDWPTAFWIIITETWEVRNIGVVEKDWMMHLYGSCMFLGGSGSREGCREKRLQVSTGVSCSFLVAHVAFFINILLKLQNWFSH